MRDDLTGGRSIATKAERRRSGGLALGADAQSASWFFENASDLFGVVAQEGVFLQVNPAWEAVTGWTRDDLVGRDYREFLHADSHEAAIEMAQNLAEEGFSRVRVQWARRGGGWIWLEGFARNGPNGEIMGTLRDVSEELRRSEELERARHAQTLLSETAGVGLWRYDPRTEEFEWSAEWQTMHADAGVSIRNYQDFTAICHPDDLVRALDVINRAANSGKSGAYNYRFKDGRGSWNWMRVHVCTERVAENLHIIHGISQNVTELAKAHQEAEAQSLRLKIALGAAMAAVVEIDYREQSLWLSAQFIELIGQSMTYGEAKKAVWPFVYREDAPIVEAAVRHWLNGGPIEPLEVRIIRPDGSECWINIYTEIQKDPNGRWLRSIHLLLDVNERKHQELALIEAERAARSAADVKSTFLANMSHEIRTPMNGVLGVLHILKDQVLQAPGRAMLDDALSCSEMLQALLDNVVDFSKLEAEQLEIHEEPLDPSTLLERVANMLRPQAEGKGLALYLEIGALPHRVMTDPVRLRQCLINLIGNAVKFTLRGSIRVRVAASGGSEGGRLRFEIEDTGIGIPDDAQGKLFERFQQADTSSTRRFGGAGLGLAITRKLAEMMGGMVGFFSEAGVGSTFWLEVSAPVVDAPGAGADDVEFVLAGVRVLVVDDNATNRLVAAKILESLGASVQTVEDGERGVEAAMQSVFDLILMDIQMPGIDGLEATRRIRASANPAARTPVIALTANVLAHQREAYLVAGMNGVVAKPLSAHSLLVEIARVAQLDEPSPVDVQGQQTAVGG